MPIRAAKVRKKYQTTMLLEHQNHSKSIKEAIFGLILIKFNLTETLTRGKSPYLRRFNSP